jgi:putative endonuclease
MHYIYIIHSPKFDKYYVGETVNVTERITQHNTGNYKGASTHFTDDWQLRLCFTVEDRICALKVERYIKTMKSKKFIEKLINEGDFLNGFKRIVLERFGAVI